MAPFSDASFSAAASAASFASPLSGRTSMRKGTDFVIPPGVQAPTLCYSK